MEIASSSHLPLGGIVYLNDSNYQGDLFFTDESPTLYYLILRKELGITKAVASGLLNGADSVNYKYRFNFDNYIKINTQEIPTLTVLNTNHYSFGGSNESTITLCLGISDIYADNVDSGVIVVSPNGEAIVTGTIIADDTIVYRFIDATDNDLYCSDIAIRGNYFPITIPKDYQLQVIINGVTTTLGPSSDIAIDYLVGLFFIPCDCYSFTINVLHNSILITTFNINTIGGSYTSWYFMNTDGIFDALNCYGVSNEIDTVSKTDTKVGNIAVITDISITKQIKQNSGFKLKQSQIYSFLSSAYVFKLDNGKFKEYLIDNSTFEGYNGLLTSGKNIEFIFTDPYQYKRKSNRTINFWS